MYLFMYLFIYSSICLHVSPHVHLSIFECTLAQQQDHLSIIITTYLSSSSISVNITPNRGSYPTSPSAATTASPSNYSYGKKSNKEGDDTSLIKIKIIIIIIAIIAIIVISV